MRQLRAPLVRSGQPITASWANTLAQAVNGALQSPVDLDTGAEAPESLTINIPEQARTTEEVRVENPEDSEQYVNLNRAVVSRMYNPSTGETWLFEWLNG